MNKQIVYVLTNAAMPGYVKIGFTKRELNLRLNDLDNTSVPIPFECVYAREVENARAVEKLLHSSYSEFRTRSNREFFEVPIQNIIYDLQLFIGTDVILDNTSGLNEEDIQVREKAKIRRERFSFKMVEIPVDEQLHFYKDPNTICKVLDNNKVLFEGKEMSLSQSALMVLNKQVNDWKTVSGPTCWTYESETLDKRRRRFEEG